MSKNHMNQYHSLSYDLSFFLNYEKVPKVQIFCSYSKHLGILALADDPAIKDLSFCKHSPDFEDFSILTTNNNFKVVLMDCLLITRDCPSLNSNNQS